ncbi:uncharacterized protein LOC131595034 isoform X2 [Vicia villosa]|uniref:uncharacterized protein LOC131595034 isoform X2 n=1 Tax=Vicia villosa TaxID=3911 RepID=UPI00273A7DEA|nr:uncharacterized protein LOC131595034 isoform X2 [Vicia villosa]XP_058723238.1 uncharacterized protein LOC131595034 isoform X2 [Vicia villosa]XP_058723239.1 uncharacterized protein LOC131595034 isoform X2 [Vicia villosa]
MVLIETASEWEELNQRYRSEKVSVWWVLENWDEYKDVDPCRIKENISIALAKEDYKGSVSISCYVDEVNATKIPEHVLTDLSSSGISTNHYPKDEKPVMLIVDMLRWAESNPPPANYLFIFNDDDDYDAGFTYAIDYLLCCKYNILLASPEACAPSLVSLSKRVWLVRSLFSGESPASEEQVMKLRGSDSDEEVPILMGDSTTGAPILSQLLLRKVFLDLWSFCVMGI